MNIYDIIIFKFSVNCDHWLSTSQGMWLCKLNQQNRPMLAGSWYCCCIVVVYFCQSPPVLQSISQGVNIIEWKCQSLSHVWFFATPWSVACQAPLSMGFPRQECWSELLSFSRGFSWPRDWTHISCIGRWILYHLATREVQEENRASV